MGRGVSSGGGQSSLGYLFGSGESSKPAAKNSQAASTEAPAVAKPVPAAQPADITKQIPAGSTFNQGSCSPWRWIVSELPLRWGSWG
ncbi:Protein SPIRAL1-like 1 [Hibiscus syriacus]|uniref:Protein SPIRAL1-like 1 n=1 Tax=Hibiscus syriacus TaxID=106335 RepID=A0A6A2X2A9_HIBSY|nr:Protein SPIRAL1-like 1 [Hibiscus syriacus]